MAARTVLNTLQTAVTSFDSGVLSVGDLTELALDLFVTNATGGTVDANGNFYYAFQLYRIDARGNQSSGGISVFGFMGYGSLVTSGSYNESFGAGINQWSFGDQIQVVMQNTQGCSLTFSLSIKGK